MSHFIFSISAFTEVPLLKTYLSYQVYGSSEWNIVISGNSLYFVLKWKPGFEVARIFAMYLPEQIFRGKSLEEIFRGLPIHDCKTFYSLIKLRLSSPTISYLLQFLLEILIIIN